jgi:hypothetical protein
VERRLPSLVLVSVLCGVAPRHAWAQEPSRSHFFFESNFLFRVTEISVRDSSQASPWYVTSDGGFLYRRGTSTALGVSAGFGLGQDFGRVTLRPRVRRWLTPTSTIDVGAGVVLVGSDEITLRKSPGFSGFVTVAQGRWVGVTVQVESVRSAYAGTWAYDPAQGKDVPLNPGPFETEWAVYTGFRMGGVPAAVLAGLEVLFGLIGAASI